MRVELLEVLLDRRGMRGLLKPRTGRSKALLPKWVQRWGVSDPHAYGPLSCGLGPRRLRSRVGRAVCVRACGSMHGKGIYVYIQMRLDLRKQGHLN